MDSPSSDLPPPIVLSRREYEAGDVSQTVQRTGRTTAADIVLVAGFGNAIAADYATFVTQRSQGDAVVVDEKTRRLADPPIDWLSMDDFLRSNLETRSENGQGPSLVLFIGSRLTAPTAVSWTTYSKSHADGSADLSASSVRFGSISTIPRSSRPRTTSLSSERLACSRRRLSSRTCA